MDVQHFQPWARERVWGGVGVAGRGVNGGSSILDSTQSHHWGNHLHCLCLRPTTSDKMAWLQKNKVHLHLRSISWPTWGFTCCYLGLAQSTTQPVFLPSSSDGWLPFNVVFTQVCFQSVALSRAITSVKRSGVSKQETSLGRSVVCWCLKSPNEICGYKPLLSSLTDWLPSHGPQTWVFLVNLLIYYINKRHPLKRDRS